MQRRVRVTVAVLLAAAGALALAGLLAGTPGGRPAPGGPPRAYRPVRLKPGRTYDVQLWDFRYPLEGGASYEELVRRWADAFTAAHPQVRVHVRLFSFADGESALRAALQAGRPPDVFAGTWDVGPVASPLAVPVGPYADGAARGAYVPVAWRAVAAVSAAEPGTGAPIRPGRGPTLAGWPRWLVPAVWVARRQALAAAGLDPLRLAREGWTWRDVTAIRQAGVPWLVPAGDGTYALRSLAAAAGVPWPGSGGAGLVASAAWLGDLRREGALPRWPSLAREGTVARYAAGRGTLLMGPAPPVAAAVLAAGGGSGSVPVPVPRPPGTPYRPVLGVALVQVFRQEPFPGLDQVQAAQLVAQAYSRWAVPALTDGLLAVPAAAPAFSAWFAQSRLPAESREVVAAYLEAAARGTAPSAGSPGEPGWSERWAAAIQAFWRGSATPEELSAEIQGPGRNGPPPVPGSPGAA